MRSFIALIILALLTIPSTFAGKPTIFSGSNTKSLKQNLDLNGIASVLTGTVDPTVSAQSAPQGSLYLRTGASGGSLYIKQDAGSSTNWTKLSASAAASAELSDIFKLTGGVTVTDDMDGIRLANTARTVSSIYCVMRDGGGGYGASVGSVLGTVVEFDYGSSVVSPTSSSLLTILANNQNPNGARSAYSVVTSPGIVLGAYSVISAKVNSVASGNPEDLVCKVIY